MKKFGFSPKRSSSSFIAHYPSPSRFSLPTPSRSLSDSVMVQTLENAEPLIVKWDLETSTYAKVTSLFYDNRREALEFMKIVNKLHKAMRMLAAENSNSELLIRAQHLMQIAMKRLEKEFYQILSLNCAQLDPESVSTRSSGTSARSSVSDFVDESDNDEIRVVTELITEVEDAAEGIMIDLKLIAECMISSGYGKECVNIYKTIRKSIVDEGIYKLGVEKMKSTHARKMDWTVLDIKIKNWLDAVKITVKTLFNGERILSDHVFASSNAIREACFNEITKEGATILFLFPETVAKNSKKSAERIFRMLDMYTAIANQWPEIMSIFSFQSTSSSVNQALNSLIKLGETVRLDLTEFETLINKESLKTTVSNSGVHKFTIESMNYISLLGDYGVLTDILHEYPLPEKSQLPETFFDQSLYADSPLSLWLAWLIFVVICKLDGKSKHYKDVSQSYLFLANNVQYIVSKVRSSRLQYLLGEDWANKREADVKKFAVSYEQVAWSHVIDVVPTNVTEMAREEAINSFKKINMVFEEVHRKQLAVVVPDGKLRDEIKVSVAEKLLPAYREFYEMQRVEVAKERKFAGVVKYAPEDIGNALSDLFFGSGSASVLVSASMSESRTSLSR
ncbi:exocyst complex component EXO70H1-like [Rutidosis leptorrhynchoides]|uniref:exocyst complex component EXO70H1-like n=1 Tax=Rutidosis leptorrhynchoides TaxID=125765 RepID=UPI003A990B6E